MTAGFLPLLAAVLAIGIAALGWETDGFRVISSEGAHRLAVEQAPLPIPNVDLFDQDGRRFSLQHYRGKPIVIDFIYTRCPTECERLGEDLPRIPSSLRANLLSISIDPRDDRHSLKSYAERYGASAPHWRIAAARDQRGLAVLLNTFGVTVIPDGAGGYVHSDDLYYVDARGRLARILDSLSSS